jgi:hypothetical protein
MILIWMNYLLGFTLEVLEPHGELAFPERQGLFAQRLSDFKFAFFTEQV